MVIIANTQPKWHFPEIPFVGQDVHTGQEVESIVADENLSMVLAFLILKFGYSLTIPESPEACSRTPPFSIVPAVLCCRWTQSRKYS